MDDTIQPGFHGHFKLLLKDFRLLALVTGVIRRAATLRAGQAVVVQPAFPDRHGTGMAREFAQFAADIPRHFEGIARMPAHGGVDHLVFLRERKGAPAAVQIGGDGDDFCNTGFCAQTSTSAKSGL